MATYISSNNNRTYAAIESAYGQIPAAAAQNRIPTVKLTAKHRIEKATRRDKTGTRTFQGDPSGLRSTTNFTLSTYLTAWTNHGQEPAHGPLFQACLGNAVSIWGGGVVASTSGSRLIFAAAHNLQYGQALTVGNEMRFVATAPDSQTVVVNAPFSLIPAASTPAGPTANYQPGGALPSASIFDYWTPATALQRVLCGAALNELKVNVNGDFHELEFSGSAADVLDSASYQSGQGGLTAFPQEPAVVPYNYSIIPGHLGQVWLGAPEAQFFTVTKAQLTFNNDLALRDREFGAAVASGICPGLRNVSLDLSLYQKDDANTQALYQAARSRSPINVMLQLGQKPGQLFGFFMTAVIPEVPEFDDSERCLQLRFVNCRAQGGVNDEIFFAFG